MKFNRLNNISGWLVFAISYVVYLLTMERTVSFWDCGEFLAAAYKLEVTHSPGAPLYSIIGRFFGMFADPLNVALFINSLSALASALTILFLFWTITHFARKLMPEPEGGRQEADYSASALCTILGAGFIGALAYTFSDTFWFSAVEAEVYALSSFFTAFVFWAIFKWEHHADEPHADRWLVLIAYMMGLSIGVHLLNLLTIPALAMVYYFRRHTYSRRGALTAFIIGCVILGIVQVGVIQGVPLLASKMELLFVNSFRLPFNSGAIFFLILLAGLLAWLILWARKKGKTILHTAILCLTFVLIGYSSFVSIIIRSKADVPIDMTNPDDVMSLVSFLKRDQYGSQPLLFGPDFDAPASGYSPGTPVYREVEKDGKPYYELVGHRQPDVEYSSADKRFFPRLYSSNHAAFYRNYLDLAEGEKASMADNMKFFFSYQINWMWWRYFMWNYAGRQNDYQGTSMGEPQNGNWISGIGVVDKFFGRGDASLMPEPYKNSRARNTYFLLPFALGLMGLVYQFNRNKKDGFIITLLFFFTGIATVIYLNNSPQQPRERDYSFAGSTYAFAIWIGLGGLMVTEWFRRVFKKGLAAPVLATLLCLAAVPLLMASQNWDDHDRSQKTLARTSAYNVLAGLDSNAVLFVIGDNDTYPIWYMQEIEGFRTDVRVVNLSLAGIDWYIDQLRYKINDADALPMIWTPEQYEANKRDFVLYREDPAVPANQYFDIEQVLQLITSDDRRFQAQIVTGDYVNILPTKNLMIPVNKAEVLASGLVAEKDSARIVDKMFFSLGGGTLTKSDLAVLNIIAANAKTGWKRPIYFSLGFTGGDGYQGLDEYVVMEGLANKLVPIRTPGSSPSIGAPQAVDIEKTLDLYTNTFLWGGTERKDVYFDEKNRNMLMTYRFSGAKAAMAMIRENRPDAAIRLLDVITDKISYEAYPYDQSIWGIAEAYYAAGAADKGKQIAEIVVRDNVQMLKYMLSLKGSNRELAFGVDGQQALGSIQLMARQARQAGDTETADEWDKTFLNFASQFGLSVR